MNFTKCPTFDLTPEAVLARRAKHRGTINIAIVGLGASNYYVYQFLKTNQELFAQLQHKLGYQNFDGINVFLFDDADKPWQQRGLWANEPEVPVHKTTEEFFLYMDQIIVAPAFPLAHLQLQAAFAAGADVYGDIELFARLKTYTSNQRFHNATVIGITGSNGKTTTTALTETLARHHFGQKVVAAGNNEVPIMSVWDGDYDCFVLELSSFQLDTTYTLQCDSATILNVTEDHLDRHLTMANYVAAKHRLYCFSRSIVTNGDDALTEPVINLVAAKPSVTGYLSEYVAEKLAGKLQIDPVNGERYAPFIISGFRDNTWTLTGRQPQDTTGIPLLPHEYDFSLEGEKLENGQLNYKLRFPIQNAAGKVSFASLDQNSLQISGKHNYLNVLAALALLSLAKFVQTETLLSNAQPTDGTASVQYTLSALTNPETGFRGLDHRYQLVLREPTTGVTFINDSKATNVGSVENAIASTENCRAIHLLLGGQDKGQDFGPLARFINEKAAVPVFVHCFGQDGQKIQAKFADELLLETKNGVATNTRLNQPLASERVQSVTYDQDMQAVLRRLSVGHYRLEAYDCVLLAPGCASFDQFKSYKDRGTQFSELARTFSPDWVVSPQTQVGGQTELAPNVQIG